MHLTSDVPVILLGRLEQLQMAVRGVKPARLADCLHLGGTQGLKAARDVGARFILFGLNTTVREVLQLSKLVRIFEICESEEQAVAT